MSTFTIRVKLGLTVGFLVLVAALAMGYSLWRINLLSGQLEEIAEDRMLKVQRFSRIKDNLNSIARYSRNILIFQDTAEQRAEADKIPALRRENSELLKALDQVVVLPRGVELLKTIHTTRQEYNAELDKVLAEAMAGRQAAAATLLYEKVRPLQTVLFKAVDDSNALQMEIAHARSAQAKLDTTTTFQVMVGLLAGMIVLGGAATWALGRHLSSLLGSEPVALNDAARRVSDGDLSGGIASDAPGSVLATLGGMQQNLAQIVGRVRQASDSIATGATQIATGNADLSQRTEEQASNLQQTAASMEQLNVTVRQNADAASQASTLASQATHSAERGGELMGAVVTTMREIDDSARQIADIITVIDGIAFQTNILALNAAVEAARAGEHGRGFAVVASEVRGLAQRCAQAAKEVKALIDRSAACVSEGSRQVGDTGSAMEAIVVQIREVTELIKGIAGASVEQTAGIGQVNDAIAQLDQVTQQNAALVEESAAAAESLRRQADDLAEAVRFFKLGQVG